MVEDVTAASQLTFCDANMVHNQQVVHYEMPAHYILISPGTPDCLCLACKERFFNLLAGFRECASLFLSVRGREAHSGIPTSRLKNAL